MKTIFIEALTPDTGNIVDFFQVVQVDRKAKKDGEPYLALKLCDRTGEVSGNLWAIPEGLVLKAGDVVKVDADTGKYRDALQLKFKRVRLATAEEICLDDYIPASKQDRDVMLLAVGSFIDQIADTGLRDFVRAICADNQALLRDAPAAKSNHQPYLGGLLEHILALCRLAYGVSTVYPELNRDLLVAAAILHDIGKCWELCFQTHIGYTRQGSTMGHIVMAAQLLDRYNQPQSPTTLDPVTYEHLLHLILSHHGQREWGSPVVPMTREAQVFHLLDMIDSKYEMLTNTLAGDLDPDGMTPWNFKLGSAVWSGK